MRVARVGFAALVAIVAIASVGAAWFEEVPDLTADDAVAATEAAFEAAGLDAEVDGAPVRTTYATRTRPPVDVWSVRATVRTEPVEVQLARAGARPVAIDDRRLDGSAYVLSELEYAEVVRHVDDPARARAIRRNVAVTLGAVLVVALAIALAATTPTSKESIR